TTNSRRIICRKSHFVEKEVIADENRRLHRLGRNLCRLRNVAGEDENENDRKCQAFDPFPKNTFLRNRRSFENRKLVEADVGPVESDEIFNKDVRNFLAVQFRPRTFDHEDNFSFTSWLTRAPSALFPERRARAAFITLPISFIEEAPVSCTASAIAWRMSSSEAAAGSYSSMILISASSF